MLFFVVVVVVDVVIIFYYYYCYYYYYIIFITYASSIVPEGIRVPVYSTAVVFCAAVAYWARTEWVKAMDQVTKEDDKKAYVETKKVQ